MHINSLTPIAEVLQHFHEARLLHFYKMHVGIGVVCVCVLERRSFSAFININIFNAVFIHKLVVFYALYAVMDEMHQQLAIS